jgi:hypothetical protein
VSAPRRRTDQCAYCPEPAVDVDHVPFKKLFPKPRPSDLITVPSCLACNRTPSVDEEYVLSVVISHQAAVTPVARELRDQFFRKERTPRRRRMSQTMMSAANLVDVLTPAGIYIGQMPAFNVDRSRFDPVIEKIARGLYWHEFDERLPADYVAKTRIYSGTEAITQPPLVDLVRHGRGRAIGNGAFDYRIHHAPPPWDKTACVMLFLGALVVTCALGSGVLEPIA